MKDVIKMQFSPKIAKEIGVEEAIMYANIEYWCTRNKANNKHYYDDMYWTYNSMKAFIELFTFWSEKQIRRILNKLEKKGYIKTGNYNNVKYDRTKWYTCICPNGQMEMSKRENGKDQMGEPIPNSKPNDKPNYNIKEKNIKKEKEIEIIENKEVEIIDDIKKLKNKIPPSIEDLKMYCNEMGYTLYEVNNFHDYYSSNGWFVGKNKMKDWQAAIRGWISRSKKQNFSLDTAMKYKMHQEKQEYFKQKKEKEDKELAEMKRQMGITN